VKVDFGLTIYSVNDFESLNIESSVRHFEPCIEIVLVGCVKGNFLFLKRYVIKCDFRSSANSAEVIKQCLKDFYKLKKIRKGTLRFSIPSSNVKSFVLGNLESVKTRSLKPLFWSKLSTVLSRPLEVEFPFVFAHLKQHLGPSLQETAVDFTRISSHQVWVVTCPKNIVNWAMALGNKRVPLVFMEPSLESLRRILFLKYPQCFEGARLKKTGLLWVDSVNYEKRIRLSICDGVEIIWDRIFEPFISGSVDSLNRCLTLALTDYEVQHQAFINEAPPFYLFIESEWADSLLEAMHEFFREHDFVAGVIQPVFPESLGLMRADEFISYGLAIR
jgi:hypothetical protein